MSGQQAQLPEWIVWLQALAVPLLGLFAAGIAYQQWRTADRKVQLDLFDRRFVLYDETRNALYPIIREGKATMADLGFYLNAIDKANFLFGKDVTSRLDSLREHISNVIMYTDNIKSGPPYDRSDLKGRQQSLSKITELLRIMPGLFDPYMRIDHKAGGNFEWVQAMRIRITHCMEYVMEYSRSRFHAIKDFLARLRP